MMVQVSQTTLCNRLHSVDDRLPRWLLMCSDRIEGETLALTHEFLAIMLGCTRVSVTHSAKKLQDIGLISYFRGVIKITDCPGLIAAACECYEVVKNEYDETECN